MSKFGNKRVTIDGHDFHSKLEGNFYLACKAWKQQDKIYSFEMQVPYKLHAGIVYKLDFRIQKYCPGTVMKKGDEQQYCVEVKGYWTAVARLKKKLFEADYGKLYVHTEKEPWLP